MATIIKQLARYFSKRNTVMSSYKTTPTYIEAMYNAWLRDPTSVHRSWDTYFRNCPNLAEEELEPEATSIFKINKITQEDSSPIDKSIDAHAAVHALITKYQTRGYSIANLNPLETNLSPYPAKELHAELNFLPQDWEREYRLPHSTFIGGKERVLPLTEIIKRLEQSYCNSIGVEYMYMNSREQRNWISEHFETPNALKIEGEEQRQALTRLIRAVALEKFLTKHFPTYKNNTLKGCEILVPALKKLIDVSKIKGIKSVVMGLPQRGRLNILTNVCRKPLREIFSLFNGLEGESNDDLGDLKYCLGWSTPANTDIRFTVVPSAMQLETFVPIVLGKTRAEQNLRGDHAGKQVMSILVHDGATLYGQGVTYEATQFSTLPSYTTHGTIHIIMNTCDGFYTPTPSNSSNQPNTPNPLMTEYCRKIARALDSPIFHVNADEPEAVIHVCKVAAEWRAQFQKDVVIELVGYRYPEDKCANVMFTDLTVCKKIKDHMPCLVKYSNKLLRDYVVSLDETKDDLENFKERCEHALDSAKRLKAIDMALSHETQTEKLDNDRKVLTTGVNIETLVEIGNRFLSPPESEPNFVLNKAVHRVLLERKTMVDNMTADWTLAEALAFGSLLKEGVHVRLSVQATEYDAASQRHHLLHHQLIPGKTYNALEHVDPKQAPYELSHSTASENAVLGFQHGYSMTNPNTLVLWEAQRGDLASTAQSIIDQFIATGQPKWGSQSGLVMLLPHGLEGSGPEQSSARLERFLQMCSDDPADILEDTDNLMQCQLREINWIVANCTTPANYFHILRRQIALPFRKPLVLMTPKSLLHHNEVKSCFQDMCAHSEFKALIPENIPSDCCPANFRRLIFCSGQIYYDLIKARAERKLEDEIAIARIEQLAPFPYESVRTQLECFEHANLVWVQEEHKNQGAWSYIQPRFQATILDAREISYIGRPARGLAAAISKAQHKLEHNALLDEAMSAMPTALTGTYW